MTRVNIFRRAGRPFFEAQWKDPTTERKKTRSLGTADRREAQRRAVQLELELSAGREPTNTTWSEAVSMYEGECFPSLAPESRAKIRSTIRLVARVVNPARLAGVTEAQLARVVADLRGHDRSEATVRGHIRNIRAFLRWGVGRHILERVPKMPNLGRSTAGMKGRPITTEEFERMLQATATVVGTEHCEGWQQLLRGLWLTGLRLGEALDLDWTDDTRLAVELDGAYPYFRIQAAAEKGRRFRLLPMVPEAAEFFQATPPSARRGKVFRPLNPTNGERPNLNWTSKIITRIGKAARVAVTEARPRKRLKIDPRSQPGQERVIEPKWASAHDFRRAFGLRLSSRVRAPLLMQLMRHQNITTTLQYYVGSDAEAAARELWREMRGPANDFANSDAKRHDDQPQSN